ncbi:helix-turn-helix domain-containing protein [Dactylosporangium sp. CA-139114]|uniref:helix-turn-helix domain-containing protein n=1 Tax=Dactylosporangium sp. CA-139114 TaxID=3239931 RepID=UPI003D9940FC
MLEQPAFGQRLKTLREQYGLSQAALAEGGLSTGYVSRLESGARSPTARAVAHLARRLGVPTSAFEVPSGLEPAQTQPVPLSPFSALLASIVSATGDSGLAEPLAEALHSDPEGDPALRWQAIWLLAQIRGNQGELQQQYELLAELVELSGRLGAKALLARAQIQLSRNLRMLGNPERARAIALDAYRDSAELSLVDRAGTLQALVSAEAEAGLLKEARAHADELVEISDTPGGTLAAEALWASATVHIREGRYPAALDDLELALQRLDSHQDLILWMRLRLAAASLCLQVSPPQTAKVRERLDEVEPVLRLIGTDLHRQEAATLRAYLAFEEGDYESAWQQSEQIDEQVSLLSFRDRVKFEALRGRLILLRGERDRGIKMLQDLAQQAQEAHNVELAAEIWRSLAETLASMR